MTMKNLNAAPQRLQFIIDFEVSLDEPPPAIIFISPDEVIIPQTEAKHYDLTARITINGKQYSFSHFLASSLAGESEVKDWPQAVQDYIAKCAPEQLLVLFGNLVTEASGHAPGAPEAMVSNPGETHERLSKREKRARKSRIPLQGRPNKRREKSTTKIKHKQERASQRKKAIEAIRYCHKEHIRSNNKAKLAERMNLGSKSNRTHALNNWLRLYQFDLQELIRDALGS